jgi:hypothetical protein
MLFSSIVYIGIDPSPGKKSIHYAALSPELDLLARAHGDLNTLLAFLSGQQQAVIAIHGPARPNARILTNADRREQYLIPLSKGRPGNMRVAEYTLRQHGLPVFQTPAKAADAPQWMQTAFKLTEKLGKSGYQPWQPGADHLNQILEVLPELGYRAWLPGQVLPANSLHGRLQRMLALYDLGLKLPDPMSFFEEITRYRLLQGVLPLDTVLSAPALSAMAAAYLAWQAAHQPADLTQVGIPQEGQITLPAALLRDQT